MGEELLRDVVVGVSLIHACSDLSCPGHDRPSIILAQVYYNIMIYVTRKHASRCQANR